jgi:hypothetical protein
MLWHFFAASGTGDLARVQAILKSADEVFWGLMFNQVSKHQVSNEGCGSSSRITIPNTSKNN